MYFRSAVTGATKAGEAAPLRHVLIKKNKAYKVPDMI
jgi:hypothetical protein